MPGPPPKRANQRRRANKPVVPTTEAEGGKVVIPPADGGWCRPAKQWYESLKLSGQSVFYTSGDWSTAWMIAESMHREFAPQPVTVGRGEEAHTVMVRLPPKGASLMAWLKAMSGLMVLEGDRRRVRIELAKAKIEGEEPPDASELAEYRERLRSAG